MLDKVQKICSGGFSSLNEAILVDTLAPVSLSEYSLDFFVSRSFFGLATSAGSVTTRDREYSAKALFLSKAAMAMI